MDRFLPPHPVDITPRSRLHERRNIENATAGGSYFERRMLREWKLARFNIRPLGSRPYVRARERGYSRDWITDWSDSFSWRGDGHEAICDRVRRASLAGMTGMSRRNDLVATGLRAPSAIFQTDRA